jgi:hypothetical protein
LYGVAKKPSFPRKRETGRLTSLGSRFCGSDEELVISVVWGGEEAVIPAQAGIQVVDVAGLPLLRERRGTRHFRYHGGGKEVVIPAQAGIQGGVSMPATYAA